MDIQIVNSTLNHVKELSESIRQKDQEEAIALGLKPHRALFFSYKHAVLRRSCLVDGKVAAMWGVCGTPLGMRGQPYLITGEVSNTVSPIRFAKIYLKEVENMKSLFPVLENYVHSSYEGAVGMLRLAGFKLDEPIDIKGSKFQRFSMVNN